MTTAALVTGGGSGIGRATAQRLASSGAKVAVVDVRPGAADAVAAAITAAGGCAIGETADVRDEDALERAYAASASRLGGLDAVVACAGIAVAGPTHTTSLAEWEALIGVNLTGVFLTVKHALPHLLEAGGGAIVTIGSVASLVAAGRTSSYDATKGGVLQFTRAVAAEYADRGIRANCVCPGLVDTDLAINSHTVVTSPRRSRREPRGEAPRLRVQPPMPRAADPAEIAAVAAFLCSDDASFITGAAIPVDGGYTAI